MKNLTKTKILAYVDNPEDVILKQQERIEFLENWLNSVLVRSDEDRVDAVKTEIKKLESVKVNILTYYVENMYSHNYFIKECDTKFKTELAQSILDYVRIFYPSYVNELLQNVALNKSEYAANFIFMEKL